MDIEELSKSQLLLLTVMVNFIVAIATSILTVSLLDEAPQTVTQTVNRIVDHTIETIATPIEITNPIRPAATPAAPNTEQLLTSALGEAVSRSVLIYRRSTSTPAIAYGTYLSKSGAVVTANVQGLPRGDALIEFSDGSALEASISKTSGSLVLYGFSDGAVLPQAPEAELPDAGSLKLGQTLAGLTKDLAAITGIVSRIDGASIFTNLSGLPVGAGVVDLTGAVVGIGSPTPGVLIAADSITALLATPAD